jgi:drug/metabolite transporter (DMT)-like permease
MAFGDASAAAGLITLFSAFVTGRLFGSSPVWIFVIGVILGVVSVWLASRAFKAPRGSRGRGTAVAGIVVAILGMLFCTFIAIVASILNHDTL